MLPPSALNVMPQVCVAGQLAIKQSGQSLVGVPVELRVLAAQASAAIIVTGRALPPPDASTVSIIVLERRDLEQSASGRLESVLSGIPGVQTFRRADSASAHPTTAGLTARGLGGNAASRMLLVVDGVPQTDPFGGWVDFPLYSLGRIARLSVERGGGQARWGSGALAGAVEIDSIGPADAEPVTASARYGSRNSIDLSGSVFAKGAKAYVMAGAALRRSNGFIPVIGEDRGPADIRAPYRQVNVLLRGAVALSPTLEAQGGVQLVDDRRTRGLANSRNRTRGGDASIRLVGKGAAPFQLALYRQVRRFESQFAAAGTDRSTSRITLDQFRVPASGWGARGEIDLLSGDFRLRLGADLRTGKGVTNERYQYLNGAPTRLREAGGAFATGGLLAQAGGRSGDWQWSIDGRVDRWSLTDGRLVQRLIAGGILDDVDFPDRRGWQPSGRASLALHVGAATIEAAIYRGWRLPTLNELYRPFRVGLDATAPNAALNPETLIGGEIGGRIRASGALDLRATLFVNRLDDAIANVTLGQGAGLFSGVGFVAAGGSYSKRLNLRAIKSAGGELSGEWRIGAWSAKVSATAVRARISGGSVAAQLAGKRPAQVPAYSMVVHGSWNPEPDRWLSISLRRESQRYEDDLNSRRLKGALTLEASAQWPLSRSVAVTSAIENLLDGQVESGTSGHAIERSMPRMLWIGLALRR